MNPVLKEIYTTGSVTDAQGNRYKLHSGISKVHAEALYQLVRDRKPATVVEIGMAYGLSTLAILSALEDAGEGNLISIDPYQRSDWHGVGLANVHRAQLSARHRLIEEPSYLALPELLRRNTSADFAYVDGWHTFDYVLVDFFYLDKLLNVGGVIGFNDCGLWAVDRVISFVLTHRHYQELRGAAPVDYRGRNWFITVIRQILNKPRSDRYFVKTDLWEPPWNYYAKF